MATFSDTLSLIYRTETPLPPTPASCFPKLASPGAGEKKSRFFGQGGEWEPLLHLEAQRRETSAPEGTARNKFIYIRTHSLTDYKILN